MINDTYQGTMLNNPPLPSAGEDEACKSKVVTTCPSELSETKILYGPLSTSSLGDNLSDTSIESLGLIETDDGETAGRHPETSLPSTSITTTLKSPFSWILPSFLTVIVVD